MKAVLVSESDDYAFGSCYDNGQRLIQCAFLILI